MGNESEIDRLASQISDAFVSGSEETGDGMPANVVDAIFEAGREISRAMKLLGTADAATPMGAIEAHGVMLKEAGDAIARGLSEVAEAIRFLAESRE